MKRARRILLVLAASLLLLGIPAGPAARGQEESGSSLFGWGMTATATAMSTLYDQPSFGVPQSPTFELRKIYSTALLDSGPTGRALGSVLWPGDVVGNAPPALAFDVLLFNPTQLDCLDPGEKVCLNDLLQRFKTAMGKRMEDAPPYPIRSESSYPPGQSGGESTAGMDMRSRASDVESEAYSSSTRLDGLPGVISVGSLESLSNSRVTKTEAIAEARSRTADLDFLGIVHVDQIITTTRAVSDGTTARVEGALEITGLTITNPEDQSKTRLVYDRTGLHVDPPEEEGKESRDRDYDPNGTRAAELLARLEKQGISISIGGPLDTVDGASAMRAVNGLIIHLNSTGMERLMGQLKKSELGARIVSELQNPAGGVLNPVFRSGGLLSPTVAGYLASFFQADQTLTFVFGSNVVQSAASPALPPIDIPPILPDVPGFGPVAPPADFGGGGGFTGGGTGATVGGTQVLSARPVAVLGVPVGFLGLILVLALAGAAGLRRLADYMTTGRAVTRCPLEGSS